MKRVFQAAVFGLLAVGVAVSVVGIVASPWYASPLFALAGSGCMMAMIELFGGDVG